MIDSEVQTSYELLQFAFLAVVHSVIIKLAVQVGRDF